MMKTIRIRPLYVDAVVQIRHIHSPGSLQKKKSMTRDMLIWTSPKSKADYAFLLHDLYHIRPDGIMTIVLPHGVLFSGGEEGNEKIYRK